MWSGTRWGPIWLFVVLLATPLSGVEISEVAPGVYRSRPLESAADYQQVRRFGIRTVIDLRNFRRLAIAREGRQLAALGIAYYQVPIRFPLRDNSPDQALALLTNPRLQPVLIHCNLGNDRNGLVVALYRVRYQAWTKSAALAEMERFGFHHFLGGLEQYLWNYPAPTRPANAPSNRIEQQGSPIIAAGPTPPSRNARRGFYGRRWR